MKVRVSEHQSVLWKTEKPVKGTLLTSVRDHVPIYDQLVACEDFRILGS